MGVDPKKRSRRCKRCFFEEPPNLLMKTAKHLPSSFSDKEKGKKYSAITSQATYCEN